MTGLHAEHNKKKHTKAYLQTYPPSRDMTTLPFAKDIILFVMYA